MLNEIYCNGRWMGKLRQSHIELRNMRITAFLRHPPANCPICVHIHRPSNRITLSLYCESNQRVKGSCMSGRCWCRNRLVSCLSALHLLELDRILMCADDFVRSRPYIKRTVSVRTHMSAKASTIPSVFLCSVHVALDV